MTEAFCLIQRLRSWDNGLKLTESKYNYINKIHPFLIFIKMRPEFHAKGIYNVTLELRNGSLCRNGRLEWKTMMQS